MKFTKLVYLLHPHFRNVLQFKKVRKQMILDQIQQNIESARMYSAADSSNVLISIDVIGADFSTMMMAPLSLAVVCCCLDDIAAAVATVPC